MRVFGPFYFLGLVALCHYAHDVAKGGSVESGLMMAFVAGFGLGFSGWCLSK